MPLQTTMVLLELQDAQVKGFSSRGPRSLYGGRNHELPCY
jgi:hypothetical protein